MLRLFPNQQGQENELEIAKARFKVAAIQAAPTEIVRRHPIASLLGTTAIALAVGALAGGSRKQPTRAGPARGHRRRDHDDPPEVAAPKSTWIGPLVSMASNLAQAYITKQMHDSHQATAANQATGTNGHDGR